MIEAKNTFEHGFPLFLNTHFTDSSFSSSYFFQQTLLQQHQLILIQFFYLKYQSCHQIMI